VGQERFTEEKEPSHNVTWGGDVVGKRKKSGRHFSPPIIALKSLEI